MNWPAYGGQGKMEMMQNHLAEGLEAFCAHGRIARVLNTGSNRILHEVEEVKRRGGSKLANRVRQPYAPDTEDEVIQ